MTDQTHSQSPAASSPQTQAAKFAASQTKTSEPTGPALFLSPSATLVIIRDLRQIILTLKNITEFLLLASYATPATSSEATNASPTPPSSATSDAAGSAS